MSLSHRRTRRTRRRAGRVGDRRARRVWVIVGCLAPCIKRTGPSRGFRETPTANQALPHLDIGAFVRDPQGLRRARWGYESRGGPDRGWAHGRGRVTARIAPIAHGGLLLAAGDHLDWDSPIFTYAREHEAWRWNTPPDRTGEFATFMADASGLDPIGQVISYAMLPLRATVEELEAHPEGRLLLSWGRRHSDGYRLPVGVQMQAMQPVIGLLSAFADDLHSGRLRADDLIAGAEQTHRALVSSAQLEGAYGINYATEVLLGARSVAGDGVATLDMAAALLFAYQVWARIMWLAESRSRGGLVLSKRVQIPLPADPDECFALAHRLGWNQPVLRRNPAVASLVPHDPDRLLGIGPALADALINLVAPDDELTVRLIDEAMSQAHYRVDHLAVIELDERSVRRIALGPESPEEVALGASRLAFALEHTAGWVFGEVLIGHSHAGQRPDESYPELEMIEVNIPAIDTLDFMGPESTRIRAILRMMVAATYRDLVVPRVRDEHYEAQMIGRGPKKKGREKAIRSGQVQRVGYLPRRIALRRADQAAPAGGGEGRHVRRYAVGVFTRRLPEGHQRSEDAEDFAREIRIPLSEQQTVARPHFRGGTDDEDVAVRHWKSWSALDLLRTRPRYVEQRDADTQGPSDTTA